MLAAAEFNIEITTAVLWLNERGLDIRCVRLQPYRHGDDLLIDVQQLIPLPEAAEYQVRVREKEQRERQERKAGRDLTRYDVHIAGEVYARQAKGHAIYLIVRHLVGRGVTPSDIKAVIDWRPRRLFREVEGEADSETSIEKLQNLRSSGGLAFDPRRYYCDDGAVSR